MRVAETTVTYTRRYTQVAMQKVMYLRHTQLLYIASRVCMRVSLGNSLMYAGFLKETHVHIKNTHFKGTSGHFQTLVSSEIF